MALKPSCLLSLALCCACAAESPKRLVVPDSMRAVKRGPLPADAPLVLAGAQTPPRAVSRAVIRLTDGSRVWEIEVPDSDAPFVAKIPLEHSPAQAPTLADRALGGAPAKADQSYLAGLSRVGELFAAKRFELALIELASVEKTFPQEPRVHAMKGTLLLKLGKKDLAREEWRRSLELDPNDAATAEALRELGTSSKEE